MLVPMALGELIKGSDKMIEHLIIYCMVCLIAVVKNCGVLNQYVGVISHNQKAKENYQILISGKSKGLREKLSPTHWAEMNELNFVKPTLKVKVEEEKDKREKRKEKVR